VKSYNPFNLRLRQAGVIQGVIGKKIIISVPASPAGRPSPSVLLTLKSPPYALINDFLKTLPDRQAGVSQELMYFK